MLLSKPSDLASRRDPALRRDFAHKWCCLPRLLVASVCISINIDDRVSSTLFPPRGSTLFSLLFPPCDMHSEHFDRRVSRGEDRIIDQVVCVVARSLRLGLHMPATDSNAHRASHFNFISMGLSQISAVCHLLGTQSRSDLSRTSPCNSQ